ncbi:NAD(+) kinase [Pannus brasiliensis CCIBt3594]|uniref:NAD kinase n=1 Tax=Pannus brasiliensis CCIBt3594 TaxID=1427578 RepID=A0AAW9QIB2_9CHRO
MPKIGIIYNDIKPIACKTAYQIQEQLLSGGWEVIMATGNGGLLGHSRPGRPVCFTPIEQLIPPGFDTGLSFALILGGDGTVLSAARQLAPLDIPLLAINTGHMGFLTEIYLNQLHSALEQVLLGEYSFECRSTLTVSLYRENALIWEALSLNEVVVHREPLTSMCHFEIQIGHHAPVDIAADGVILSTPTGSTAYALSAGGPVLTPDIPVLQLAPICPHSLASRSLVFSDRETVNIFPATDNEMVMVVDGNGGAYIVSDDRIHIEKSRYTVRFIRLQPPEFFRILREKLGWGLPHIAKPTSVELP